MTRSVWLRADDDIGNWDDRRQRIVAGIEAGVDWVLVDQADVDRVRELGSVSVAAFRPNEDVTVIDEAEGESVVEKPDALAVGKQGEGDGTVSLPEDFSESADLSTLRRHESGPVAAYVEVRDGASGAFAETAAELADVTILDDPTGPVSDLEELIATIGEDTHLVVEVESGDEARTAFEDLAVGAAGVMLDTDDPDLMETAVAARNRAERETLELEYATVAEVEPVGQADRVFVDTGSILDDDEGLLVGSMQRGLLFVHGHTQESPGTEPRPFRVNAGAVHSYVRTPEGGTKYLAELTSGDGIQVVDAKGHTRETIVGRAKIEQRPMLRLQLDTGDDLVEVLLEDTQQVSVQSQMGAVSAPEVTVGDELLFYSGTTTPEETAESGERILER